MDADLRSVVEFNQEADKELWLDIEKLNVNFAEEKVVSCSLRATSAIWKNVRSISVPLQDRKSVV